MCWRDDVVRQRTCIGCGQGYYSDLGHRNCPGPKRSSESLLREQQVVAIGKRHGWDKATVEEKIRRTKEILALKTESDAIDFLLEVIPNPRRDIIEKLDEEHPPF